MSRDDKYDCLLFDIGGVLVEHNSATKIMEWMGDRIGFKEMLSKLALSDAIMNYEKGLITSEEFAKRAVEELQLNIGTDTFLAEFAGFITRLFPGVPELMKELEKQYVLATLSNTNELHWEKMCREFGFDKIIKTHFLSFRIGAMKPEQEIYRHVICELSCDPSRILFFDDNNANVEAARRAGMDAFHVSGFEDVKQKLLDIGVIEKC